MNILEAKKKLIKKIHQYMEDNNLIYDDDRYPEDWLCQYNHIPDRATRLVESRISGRYISSSNYNPSDIILVTLSHDKIHPKDNFYLLHGQYHMDRRFMNFDIFVKKKGE